jgi:SpoVK/Ycf46/Vps4 family AAA+-type ATPase
VPLPDARQRHRILSVLLRGEDVDETLWADEEEEEVDAAEQGGSVLAEVAAATEGYSGSDLQDLCKQAALLPIHDLLEEEEAAAASGRPMRRDAPRALTAEDLFTVLEVRLALPNSLARAH